MNYEKERTKYFNELLENLEEELEIDILSLHKEWIRQPSLYNKYAQALAEAGETRDYSKSSLEETRAKLDISIRKKKAENKEKVTESVIQSSIIEEKEYKEAENIYLSNSGIVSRLSAAVKSLDQRKKALEGLVQLYMGEYFSVPKENKIRRGEYKDKSFEKEREEKTETVKENRRRILNIRRGDN